MSLLELPHTRGCLVCGRDNPFGLHLHLNVDDQTGIVTCDYTPSVHHIGFEGIIHGGLLATVLDEAMVWAATWSGKRFCVCGELNVRYRHSVGVAQPVQVAATISATRSRLIETTGIIRDASGKVLVEATGKYVPVPAPRNREFVATLVPEPRTSQTLLAFENNG
jgi:acyl-coenzyme A thioesterase PaaI-like protein